RRSSVSPPVTGERRTYRWAQILTVWPSSTTAPPSGDCFQTWPGRDRTPSGGSSATMSTLSRARRSIPAASSTGKPTVLRTETGRGGPDETTMATVDAGVTGVPGPGLWSATIPSARSRLGFRSVSTLKPAASRTDRAWASYWPRTSGSGTVPGGDGTPAATAACSAAAASGAGNGVTGVPASAGSITRCQISAGQDPPVTLIGVAGGVIDRSRSGNPTQTAVTRSGV